MIEELCLIWGIMSYQETIMTGGDNSNKRCLSTTGS